MVSTKQITTYGNYVVNTYLDSNDTCHSSYLVSLLIADNTDNKYLSKYVLTYISLYVGRYL